MSYTVLLTKQISFTNGNRMAIRAPLTRGERKKMAKTQGLPETQIKASIQFFFINVASEPIK